MSRLDDIQAQLDAATPGPWERDEEGFMGCGQVYTANADLYGGNIAAPSGDLYPRSGYSPKDDMVFIAAAPENTRYLLDLARKAEAAKALHRSSEMPCTLPKDQVCIGCGRSWPCPTTKALDGAA